MFRAVAYSFHENAHILLLEHRDEPEPSVKLRLEAKRQDFYQNLMYDR